MRVRVSTVAVGRLSSVYLARARVRGRGEGEGEGQG